MLLALRTTIKAGRLNSDVTCNVYCSIINRTNADKVDAHVHRGVEGLVTGSKRKGKPSSTKMEPYGYGNGDRMDVWGDEGYVCVQGLGLVGLSPEGEGGMERCVPAEATTP